MQRRPAFFQCFAAQRGAHFGIGFGHVVEPVHQSLEIQHGAAHQQGQFAARGDVTDQDFGIVYKFSGAVGMQRVAYVDQVVRHRRLLGRCRLGRANVHAAIHQG